MQDRVWEIISAKINGELLSLSEEEELLQWMDESPDRRLLFHRLEKYYRACRAESKIDVDAAYEKYLAGLSKVKKRRQERLYRYFCRHRVYICRIVLGLPGRRGAEGYFGDTCRRVQSASDDGFRGRGAVEGGEKDHVTGTGRNYK